MSAPLGAFLGVCLIDGIGLQECGPIFFANKYGRTLDIDKYCFVYLNSQLNKTMDILERTQLIRKIQDSTVMEFVWDEDNDEIIADCLQPEDFQAAVTVNYYYMVEQVQEFGEPFWEQDQHFLKDMFYAHVESIYLREP